MYDTSDPNIVILRPEYYHIPPKPESDVVGNVGGQIIPLRSVVLTMVGFSANRKGINVMSRFCFYI